MKGIFKSPIILFLHKFYFSICENNQADYFFSLW